MRPVNPVLRRELLERWRGRRAVILLSAFLAVLGGVVYLLERIGRAVLTAQGGPGPDGMETLVAGPLLGAFLVEGLLFFVLLFVLFVAPGHAAAQLVGERERRTLPLLQATLLRPWQIVAGKLGASVTWLVLLVVATVPLGAMGFFLGGVAIGDLLRATAFVLVVAVSVAAMGLGISAVTRRTAAAVALTYGLVLVLLVGTPLAALGEFALRVDDPGRRRPPTPIALYANPFFGLADAARANRPSEAGFSRGAQLPSPLGVIAQALPRERGPFGPGMEPGPGGMEPRRPHEVPGPEPMPPPPDAVEPAPEPPPDARPEPAPEARRDTGSETGPDLPPEARPSARRGVDETQEPPPAAFDGDVDGPRVEAAPVEAEAAPVEAETEPLHAPPGAGGEEPPDDRRSVWLIVAGIYAGLGAAALTLATWRVRVAGTAVAVPLRRRGRRGGESEGAPHEVAVGADGGGAAQEGRP